MTIISPWRPFWSPASALFLFRPLMTREFASCVSICVNGLQVSLSASLSFGSVCAQAARKMGGGGVNMDGP